MKKLSRGEFLQVSVMLFGLFFGAGNLIIPPLLGNQSGGSMVQALISFSITAVVFPVLGVIAVSKTDGLKNLALRVGPIFSIVFTTAIYLAIGPGLGIPRAGALPYELAIAPYIEGGDNFLIRLTYTFIFFLFAYLIALRPRKIVKRIGKFMTPALLLLILIMFIGILTVDKNINEPLGDYVDSPIVKGFLEGYNTMDAIAALNFGVVVSLAISGFGILKKEDITRYSLKSGILAGSLLFIVYFMLSYIGMVTSGLFVGAENGALILSNSIRLVYGDFGGVLLALIFTLACLTTCVGLITSGSEYFYRLFNKRLSYVSWVSIWTGISFITANFGLNKILAISIPVLNIIYPISLVLILMGISHDFVKYPKKAYLITAIIAVILPFLFTMEHYYGLDLGFLSNIQRNLPLNGDGLSWILPSFISILLFTSFDKLKKKDI